MGWADQVGKPKRAYQVPRVQGTGGNQTRTSALWAPPGPLSSLPGPGWGALGRLLANGGRPCPEPCICIGFEWVLQGNYEIPRIPRITTTILDCAVASTGSKCHPSRRFSMCCSPLCPFVFLTWIDDFWRPDPPQTNQKYSASKTTP